MEWRFKVDSFIPPFSKFLKAIMPRRPYNFEFWVTPKIIAERRDLSLEDKAVISILITRYNGEAPLKMKQETIAKYLGITRQTVAKSLKTLEKKGLINIGRVWKLSTYTLKG